jgi:hypothetical protein
MLIYNEQASLSGARLAFNSSAKVRRHESFSPARTGRQAIRDVDAQHVPDAGGRSVAAARPLHGSVRVVGRGDVVENERKATLRPPPSKTLTKTD